VRDIYTLLIGKPERKRLFGRFRNRREEDSKVKSESTDCILVLQDKNQRLPFLNVVMNSELSKWGRGIC
jgi:hypothetical protein